jgi:hypothetical protein
MPPPIKTATTFIAVPIPIKPEYRGMESRDLANDGLSYRRLETLAKTYFASTRITAQQAYRYSGDGGNLFVNECSFVKTPA